VHGIINLSPPKPWSAGEQSDRGAGVKDGGASGGGDVGCSDQAQHGGDNVADGGQEGGGVAGPARWVSSR
jgi:hypothetical protein